MDNGVYVGSACRRHCLRARRRDAKGTVRQAKGRGRKAVTTDQISSEKSRRLRGPAPASPQSCLRRSVARLDSAHAQAVYNDGIAPECDIYKFELLPDFLDPPACSTSTSLRRAGAGSIHTVRAFPADQRDGDPREGLRDRQRGEPLLARLQRRRARGRRPRALRVGCEGNDPEDPRSPDKIEVEWEIGTRPNEHHGEGAVPFFPKWVWPSVDDRVWAEGNWVHDCGHPTARDGGHVYRTEIHSGRALAAMRDQSRALPGSGTTPVPVTATDLYISGRGGFMVEQLHCGSEIILTGAVCPTVTNPIAENFEFDICIPPKPFGTALLGTLTRDGPGNTIQAPEPDLDLVEASEDCKKAREPGALGQPRFDQNSMVHARIDLSGSGQPDTAVYARRLYIGWVFPSGPPLRHFRLTLNRMDLHDDHDVDPGDCECTFFWLNVSTAEAEGNPVENEWIRLQDYTSENLNDFDGDAGTGGGEEADFEGAVFEFYVRNRLLPPFETRFLQDTRVFANGYDQDCVDMNLMSGGRDNRVISPAGYLDCYAGSGLFELEPGRADEFGQMFVILQSSEFTARLPRLLRRRPGVRTRVQRRRDPACPGGSGRRWCREKLRARRRGRPCGRGVHVHDHGSEHWPRPSASVYADRLDRDEPVAR